MNEIVDELVQASYSRSFEREADAEAYRWMKLANVQTSRLRDLLVRAESANGAGLTEATWRGIRPHTSANGST